MEHLYSIYPSDSIGKIEAVKNIFEQSGASGLAREEIEKYTKQAFEVLDQIDLPDTKKNCFENLERP